MTGPPTTAAGHRPGPGRTVPVSTYRVQVTPDDGFDTVADAAPYLADLGVSHVYLSPILRSGAGSAHGYDVTSHGSIDPETGGRAGFDAMVRALHEHGVRLIADVVPNHMTVPTPVSANAQLWSVLRQGRQSPHAHWFDIDWQAQDGRLLMPVLGAELSQTLADGQITTGRGGPGGDDPVVRYFEHELPIRPGTEHLDLPALLDAQWWRLAYWRDGSEELNYRRFFDVTTLAAIRVEEPDVFYRTHALLLDLLDGGALDGLRIDHPDGLADPAGYLGRLADATGAAWVVTEKILEGSEELPAHWRCSGTTGYDALLRVGGLFVDPAAAAPLSALVRDLTGAAPTIAEVTHAAKTEVVDTVLAAEVARLTRLLAAIQPDLDESALSAQTRALAALLVGMDRYRAYLVPGEPAEPAELSVIDAAADRARADLAEADHQALATVARLVSGHPVAGAASDTQALRHELVTRFQQTCGPVMAKGVEDTAFYRHVRFVALNEVGGDPARFGVEPSEFHDYCDRRLGSWPVTMTTLSTHDTKRSEDARAALAVLAADPGRWRRWVMRAHDLAASAGLLGGDPGSGEAGTDRADWLDPTTEYLLWQSTVATWPITADRLAGYATKAIREAKTHTCWTDPDEAYETRVGEFTRGIVTVPALTEHLDAWRRESAPTYRAIVLGQKLLQLTMPGVPDVYQGCELTDASLVDPDNRRPVDYAERAARLEYLDADGEPVGIDDDKLLVTSRALRMRRDHPEWFVGTQATYTPIASDSEAVVAFARGDGDGPGCVSVATRLPERVLDGHRDARLAVGPGAWRDVLTGTVHDAGPDGLLVARVLDAYPVALLSRQR